VEFGSGRTWNICVRFTCRNVFWWPLYWRRNHLTLDIVANAPIEEGLAGLNTGYAVGTGGLRTRLAAGSRETLDIVVNSPARRVLAGSSGGGDHGSREH